MPPSDPEPAPKPEDPAPVPEPESSPEEKGDELTFEDGDGEGEDEIDEEKFSDEEAEFGAVEEDNEGDVDDEEPLTFGVTDVEGENFMAVKPWIGALKEPSDWSAPDDLGTMPNEVLELSRVHGYRCRAVYDNIKFTSSGEVLYPAAAVVVAYNKDSKEQRFYQKHVDDVLCLAVDNTGTIAASGGKATISDAGRSVHPSLHIWNIESGETIAVARNMHKRAIVAVCFSPDGRYVVSVGLDNDHSMVLHDAATGAAVARVETGTDKVIGVGWNATTGYITTVGVKHVCFWKFNGSGFDRRRRGLVGRKGKRQTNLCVTFNEKGQTWTGTYSGSIYVWSGNKLRKVLKGHGGRVNAIASAAGYLVSGDTKGNVRFWSHAGERLGALKLDASVRALTVSSDGRIEAGTSDGSITEITVSMDDIEGSASMEVLVQGHFDGETWGLACDLDGTRAITAGDDNTLNVWNLETHERVQTRIIAAEAVDDGSRGGRQSTMSKCAPNQCSRAVDWGPVGTIAVGTNDGTVRILDEADLTTIAEAKVSKKPISVVKFDPTGDFVAIGAHDSQAYIYNTADMSRVSRCKGNSSWISHIDWDSNGLAIQTNSGAYELLFYTAETGEQETSGATLFRDDPWSSFTCTLGWPVKGIWPAYSKGSDINTLDRSPDMGLLAVGDDRGRIRLFRYPCLDRGSKCRTSRGHASHLTNLRFTADGSKLLSVGGNDNTLLVWSVAEAQ